MIKKSNTARYIWGVDTFILYLKLTSSFHALVEDFSQIPARNLFPCPVAISLKHYGFSLLTSVFAVLVPGASYQLPRAHGRGRGGGGGRRRDCPAL